MNENNDIYTLRRLQRNNENQALQEYLTGHPELEFTDDARLHALLALIYFLGRVHDKASFHFGQVEESVLDDPESLADFGLACFAAGDAKRALDILTKSSQMKDPGATVFQRLGGVLLSDNRVDEAEHAYIKSLELEPDRPEILSNLGGIKLRQSDLDAALEYYTRSLALKPELEITQNQRALVLVALERVDELIEEKETALQKNLDEPGAHMELISVLMQAERYAEALANLEAALDRFPDEKRVRLMYVNFCFDQKMWGKAGEKLKEWVEQDSEDMQLRLLLNEARIEAGFLDTVKQDLEELADDAAGVPKFYQLQARVLINESRAQEAEQLLQDAVDRFPGARELKFLLSEVLTSLGQLDEARQIVQEAGALNPSGVIKRVESKGHNIDDTDLEALRRVAENPLMPGSRRAGAMFSLAKVYDKRKEYDRSFETVIQANELMRPSLKYNWKLHRNQTLRMMKTFTPELVQKLTGLGHPENRPIFITGMPRSGTTLTEQILCSLPGVYGAGELPWIARMTRLVPKVIKGRQYPEAMSAFGKEHLMSAAHYYLEKVDKQNSTAARVVDKMPHNFDHIGFIALAFPKAAIIHMKREPRDVAVSNYYQNFAAAHGLMGFAFDLEDIGHMLNDHERIMNHWHLLFPNRIFELDYQELVTNPEDTIRCLLDYCHLEWDDRVLRFYETRRPVRTASIRQVRKGFYTTSAQKWRRFETYLDPLENILAQGFTSPEDSVSDAALLAAGPTR